MKILVDADACPSIDLITATAKDNNINLFLYTDTTHNLVSEYAEVMILSKGYQSVDIVIANEINKGDILITQDYGLALLALSKNANVIHPKGMEYTDSNIDQLLFERHINIKNRKQKIHVRGPKKRTKEDDYNLINSLEVLIKKNGVD